MSTIQHGTGSPSWFELASNDPERAKSFYAAVAGWQYRDYPMEHEGGHYTIFHLQDREVAATYGLPPEQRQAGVPPHWDVYFRVEDCDATVAKVRELGGSVVVEPFEVMNQLRMAVVADPEGAVFCLHQPRQHPGVGAIREAQAICWVELATRDLARAEAFYRGIFAWSLQDHPGSPSPYRIVSTVDGQVGGLLQMNEQWGDLPSHWSLYLQVEDIDSAVQAALAQGGKLNVPAFDVPEVGRIAQIADHDGAWLYLIAFPPAQK